MCARADLHDTHKGINDHYESEVGGYKGYEPTHTIVLVRKIDSQGVIHYTLGWEKEINYTG